MWRLHSLLQTAAVLLVGRMWHPANEASDSPWLYEGLGKLKGKQGTCSSVTLFSYDPVDHTSRGHLVSSPLFLPDSKGCLQKRARHAALQCLYLSARLPCPHPPRTRDRERLQGAAAVCTVTLQGQGFLPLNPGTISAESCDWDKRDLFEQFG